MDWVKVEDALPEEYKVVFVTIKGFDDPEWIEEIGIPRTWVTEAIFECHPINGYPIWRHDWDGHSLENRYEAVIAWKPIPEPYVEEE